jgi:peptide chain release factor subunit 1
MELSEEDLKYQQRKLLKELLACSGTHTSLVSLALNPSDSLIQQSKMLKNELATASNIKSRVNRHSVEEALGMAIFQLSTWKSVPPHGLFVFCGNCVLNGVEISKTVSFEPFKAIKKSMYKCDSRFHVEEFEKLFESDTAYGFIIIDGNGYLLSILKGDITIELEKYEVSLPKKHNKGGQSALRFARLRQESRANFVRKAAEAVNKHYIDKSKVCVQGIILAGNTEFKNILAESDILDQRIRSKIIKIIDIAYGEKQGLYEAIQLSKSFLLGLPYIKEKELLTRFFNTVITNSDIACYGEKTVLKALFELQIIDELFIWENYMIKYPSSDELLVDFMVNNHKSMNVKLHILSDNTSESKQFIKGFGGLCGILRYPFIFNLDEEFDESDNI